MYRKGIVRVQVFGLQFIGFNKYLDEMLHGIVASPEEAIPDAALDSLATNGSKRKVVDSEEESEESSDEYRPPCKAAKISE